MTPVGYFSRIAKDTSMNIMALGSLVPTDRTLEIDRLSKAAPERERYRLLPIGSLPSVRSVA